MSIFLKKQFGQNLLTSRDYAKKLVEVADICRDDTVLEVGAGAGMVTQYLVEEARKVVAVEIDDRFVRLIENRFKDEIKNGLPAPAKTIRSMFGRQAGKLEIKNEDILNFETHKSKLKSHNYKIVGSLPYNISKKIIKKFLEDENCPCDITVIIQKEVAEDYVAKPPKAKFLSNYVKIFGEATSFEVVPKEVFNPVPKVDGAILKIKNLELKIKNYQAFSKFLKSAFLNPRKMLVNNLAGIYRMEKNEIRCIFRKIRIEENARASNLEFGQWKELFDKLT